MDRFPLPTPLETNFEDTTFMEEFKAYVLTLPPAILAELDAKFVHDVTHGSVDRNQHGRIIELGAENVSSIIPSPSSSHENEAAAAEDSENVDDKAIIERLKDASLNLPFSELFMKILTFPLMLFRGPTKVIYTPSKALEKIKTILVFFQDNGDFTELDRCSEKIVKIYREKGDFDIVAAVTIERAQCALYQNDLRRARRFASEAHKLADHTRFPPLYHAQAHLIMSASYRYENKLGETKRYLDLAEQCFESGHSFEELSHYHEVYGSYLDKFMGTFAQPDEQFKELALTSFQKMSEIGSQDSNQRVSDKKRFYALIKSARIHLESNSIFGRKRRTVTKNSIDLAAECVKAIKRDLLGSAPNGSKIQFQMVESDLYYRQGRHDDSLELLHKSFDEAKLFGYVTEGPKITQRIQEIENLVKEEIYVVEENVPEGGNMNDNQFIDDNYSETSGSGSDVFTSKYDDT
ncbi:uncharacterized protein LOC114526390 [Dendronephthya gigantea]|uniref:uncharacterized protein LOC114526390 n=1 Tax=Dendronephthya gigantea TaxID=151771 RepID=UPI0010695F8F|nr:uncharacterized protein LOC114526390 [Dendronephthya gigantea]